MLDESGSRGMKKLKCNMCQRKFRTPVGLRLHKKLVNVTQGSTNSSVGESRQQCREVNGGNIGENTATSASTGDVSMPLEPTPQKKVFTCSTCGRQFGFHQSLAAHMVTHTGERRFLCRAAGCMKWFGWRSARNNHERSAHWDWRPFLCTQCGRSFKLSSSLRKHTNIVHCDQPRSYICPICGKQFQTPRAINLHVWNWHTDERNQVCEHCTRQFKTRQELF